MEGSGLSEMDSPVPSGGEIVDTPLYVPRGAPVPRGGGRGRARGTSASHYGTPLVGLSHREVDDNAVVEHGGYPGGRRTEVREFATLTDRPFRDGGATRLGLGGVLLSEAHDWQGPRDSTIRSGAFEDAPEAEPPRLEAVWPYADRISQSPRPGVGEREYGLGHCHGQEGGNAPSYRGSDDRHASATVFPAERWDHRGPVGRPGDIGGSERPRDDQRRPSGRTGLDSPPKIKCEGDEVADLQPQN